MRQILRVSAAAVLALTGFYGASQAADPFQGAVASVGGRPVTAGDVREVMERTDSKHRGMGRGKADSVREALELVVRERLAALDAEKSGLMAGELGDRVKAATLPAYAAIYRQQRAEQIPVSDAEIERTLPAWKMERRKARYIVTTGEKEIREALRRARAGEDFGTLAREISEGPASESGGDLGWLESGSNKYFTDEHWEALLKLKAGGVSEAFPNQIFEGGWAIAKIEAVEPYPPERVEEIRRSVLQSLREEKIQQEIAAIIEKAGVALRPEALGRLAKADRKEVLASFKGGEVTAGLFRAHLLRGQLQLAKMDKDSLIWYLREFTEQVAVAQAKAGELERDKTFAAEWRAEVDKLIVRAYFELIYDGVPVSDAEIEARYRANPAGNRRPEQVDLWQIATATEGEANEVFQRLRKGEAFEDVAVIFSRDQKERSRAGSVGNVVVETLEEPIRGTVAKLKLMEVSKPLALRFGYFVYQVRKRTPAKELTLAERSETIRKELLLEKQAKAFLERIELLKVKYKVTVDDAALAKI